MNKSFVCYFIFYLLNITIAFAQCPTTIIDGLDENIDVCETQVLDLFDYNVSVVADVPNGNYTHQWTLVESSTIIAGDEADFGQLLPNDVCEVRTFTLALDLICVADNSQLLSAGTITLSVYPLPDEVSDFIIPLNQGCTASLEDICPDVDLVFLYSYDSTATFVETAPNELALNDSVVVSFQAYFPEAAELSTSSCFTVGQYLVECSDVCPSTVFQGLNFPSVPQCENTVINLTAFEPLVVVDFVENAVFVWKDDEGNIITNPENFTPTLTDCAIQDRSYFLEIDCVHDDQLNLDGGQLDFSLSPNLDALVQLPPVCSTEITLDCDNASDFMIEYGTDGTTYSTTLIAVPDAGITTNVFYRISTTNPNYTCTTLEGQFPASCGMVAGVDCPMVIDNPVNTSISAYGNLAINLNTLTDGVVSNADLPDVNFVWLDDNGVEIINTGSALFSFNSNGINACVVDTQVIELQVECIADPSISISAGSFTVYACPNYEDENLFEFPDGCDPTIVSNCQELIIEYSIDGGTTFTTTPPPPLNLGDAPLNIIYRISLPDVDFNCIRQFERTVFCEDCPDTNTNPFTNTLCDGDQLDLTNLQVNPASDIGEWTITAVPPNGNSPAVLTGTTFDATGADEGDYIVGFFNPSLGCPDTSFQTLNVGGTLSAGEGTGTGFCSDSFIVVTLSDFLMGADQGGVWSETSTTPSTDGAFDATNGTFDPIGQAIGNYEFEYTQNSSCGGSDVATVTVDLLGSSSNPNLISAASICNGTIGNTLLNFNSLITNNDTSGSWTALNMLAIDLSNLNAVDFTDVAAGVYSFAYTSGSSSCPAITNITVNECTVEAVFPSAFSPNEDGLNDRFALLNAQDLETFDLQIYNRWGNLVYATANPSDGWDGTYKGEPQAVGVYVYFCSFGEIELMGNVTLLR